MIKACVYKQNDKNTKVYNLNFLPTIFLPQITVTFLFSLSLQRSDCNKMEKMVFLICHNPTATSTQIKIELSMDGKMISCTASCLYPILWSKLLHLVKNLVGNSYQSLLLIFTEYFTGRIN